MAPIAGATTTGTYNYYNSVVATGGTLNGALFTGPSNVNFTFDVGAISGLLQPFGGTAAFDFASVLTSLTVSLYYDYIDTPEPAAITLFGIGALGLLAVRRRGRATTA